MALLSEVFGSTSPLELKGLNIGPCIIGVGFWCILNYIQREPHKNIGNYFGPYIGDWSFGLGGWSALRSFVLRVCGATLFGSAARVLRGLGDWGL